MEKTMARAIYKKMVVGKPYTTTELFDLLGEEEYYKYIPVEMQGKDVRKIVASEMWNVVKTGYAKTYSEQQSLANVRGIKFGATPTSFTTYNVRYWVRVK